MEAAQEIKKTEIDQKIDQDAGESTFGKGEH